MVPQETEPGISDEGVNDGFDDNGIVNAPGDSFIEPTLEDLDTITPEVIDWTPGDILQHIDVDDGIGLYLKEISSVPLLTADEEVDLAQRIERGTIARGELVRGVSKNRTPELKYLMDNGWEANKHMITANLRLVVSIAKKYMGKGVAFLDLIQEGNIGLIRATNKFDYRREKRFSTYATWWIRKAVTNAIANQARTIRVPVDMGDQINKMLRRELSLAQKLGSEPTVEETASELNIPARKVEYMKTVNQRPLSLEQPTDDEEESVLGDFIEDVADTPNEAYQQLLEKHIAEIIVGLTPREAKILQLRYGLLDGEEHSLDDIGRKMNVSPERIRQIEAKALIHLRTPARKRKLDDFIT